MAVTRHKIACAAWITLALLSGCSSGPGFEARPGDVMVEASTGREEVRFYFGPETVEGAAARVARGAMQRARIPIDEVDVSETEGGLVRIKVGTSVTQRPAPFQRTLRGSALRALDGDRLLLRLPRAAEMQGRPLETSLFSKTYAIEPQDIRYSISTTRLVGGFLPLLFVLVLPYPLMRAYLRRVKGSQQDPVDKLHRVQRALMSVGLLAPLGIIPTSVATGGLAAPELLLEEAFPHASALQDLAVPAFFFLVIAVAIVPASLAAYPYVAELRGLTQSRREMGRRMIRGLLVMLGAPLLWIAATRVIETTVGSEAGVDRLRLRAQAKGS